MICWGGWAIGGRFEAPLFAALRAHAGKGAVNFHVPWHKQGRGLPAELASLDGGALFALDLTELAGLDDLHNPRGVIAHAQELAARTYGAARSFFLVNGTTVGIHALLMALGEQRTVIVPRHAHRAVLGGLILSGADPEYLMPGIIEEFGIAGGIGAGQVRQALTACTAAAAVLAVRPSYYGLAEELAGLVQAAHDAGKPLLVDEAHGAHLRFHRRLPQDAMAAGADAAVQSVHKMGGSLTQSSWLHLGRGALLSPDAVAVALNILQTTSPSYLLLASLDLARLWLDLAGADLLESTWQMASETRKQLTAVSGLQVLSEEHLAGSGCSLDPTKLVVSVSGLGLTGYQAAALLAERYNIYVEMADLINVVVFFSSANTRADCDTLVRALQDMARRERRPTAGGTQAPASAWPRLPLAAPVKRMRPRDAWFAATQRISPVHARGRISAEMVAVSPPGIPVLCPGEEITPVVQEYLEAVGKLSIPCQGPSDSTLKSIKVVVE